MARGHGFSDEEWEYADIKYDEEKIARTVAEDAKRETRITDDVMVRRGDTGVQISVGRRYVWLNIDELKPVADALRSCAAVLARARGEGAGE